MRSSEIEDLVSVRPVGAHASARCPKPCYDTILLLSSRAPYTIPHAPADAPRTFGPFSARFVRVLLLYFFSFVFYSAALPSSATAAGRLVRDIHGAPGIRTTEAHTHARTHTHHVIIFHGGGVLYNTRADRIINRKRDGAHGTDRRSLRAPQPVCPAPRAYRRRDASARPFPSRFRPTWCRAGTLRCVSRTDRPTRFSVSVRISGRPTDATPGRRARVSGRSHGHREGETGVRRTSSRTAAVRLPVRRQWGCD